MKYHPDRNKESNAESRFKEIKEAYEKLSGHPQQSQQSYEDFFKDYNSSGDFRDFDAFLKDFAAQEFYNRAREIVHVVKISLEDAYTGRRVSVGNTVINVPAGVRSGTKIALNNRIYRIDVIAHEKFKRSDNDLLVDLTITAIEAMLGVSVSLDHLSGSSLQFNIPAGIQPGQVVRIAGKGMKSPDGTKYGDILLRVSVSIPKNLSDSELAVIRGLKHNESINI